MHKFITTYNLVLLLLAAAELFLPSHVSVEQIITLMQQYQILKQVNQNRGNTIHKSARMEHTDVQTRSIHMQAIGMSSK
jgi:hypothetical protein